ncbi:MAG: GntR family transcriptional regulator [Proteobacteria bacterium]|nr:GntR family transcriptional regulator [Pseudomonadota bacterium]
MITNISNKTHLSQALLQAIRDRIVLGEYPPGQLLSEKELCEEFKVSRTPFREAIRKLEELKLVKVVPRFGSYVAEIDILEVKHAYEVRRPLEVLAARLAGRRRTPRHIERFEALAAEVESLRDNPDGAIKSSLDRQFHQLTYEASQNPILVETLENLSLVCFRVWNSFIRDSFSVQEIVDGFNDCIEALKEKDEDTLARLADIHIQKTQESLKNLVF